MKKYKKGQEINGVFTVGQYLVTAANSQLFGQFVFASGFFYQKGVAIGIVSIAENEEPFLFESVKDVDSVYYITCTHEIHATRGGGQKAWTYTKEQLHLAKRHYDRLLVQPYLYTDIQTNF